MFVCLCLVINVFSFELVFNPHYTALECYLDDKCIYVSNESVKDKLMQEHEQIIDLHDELTILNTYSIKKNTKHYREPPISDEVQKNYNKT